MPRVARLSLVAALAAGGVLALAGCNQAGDLPEWSPADHDGDAKAGQVDGVAAPGQEDAVIVSMAWKQSCASCHGPDGKGNTPEGRMNRVPDLTVSKGSDEELAAVIAKGRNKMPAFGNALPPNVVTGLVAHIRSLGGRGPKR